MTQEPVVLTVESIGVRGDGVAHHGGARVFLPFTLPGDRVRARIGARHGDGCEGEVLGFEATASRQKLRCPHFGLCGGCALQHLPAELYAASKAAWLKTALERQGLADAPIHPIRLIPPGTRRRARFTLRRPRGPVAVEVGFQARASHRVIDMQHCAVLHPRLLALVAPLRRLAPEILAPDGEGAATATLAESGIDLLFDLAREPALGALEALGAFARSENLARLAWRVPGASPMPVAQQRPVRVTMGGVAIDLPHDAFLQASAEADAALIAAVTQAASGASHIADLFAGIGTFTFPLAAAAAVHAVEGDEAALAALTSAAARAGLGTRVTAAPRDLVRRPLGPAELARFDCVLFDPPRAGAIAQARALGISSVRRAIAVSCNQATFARDARALADGGFRIVSIAPFDSFVWSPHLELVALFER